MGGALGLRMKFLGIIKQREQFGTKILRNLCRLWGCTHVCQLGSKTYYTRDSHFKNPFVQHYSHNGCSVSIITHMHRHSSRIIAHGIHVLEYTYDTNCTLVLRSFGCHSHTFSSWNVWELLCQLWLPIHISVSFTWCLPCVNLYPDTPFAVGA